MSYSVEKKALHSPSLGEISKILSKGLSENFEQSSCEVVSCPDLTKEPWGMASPGLSGDPRVGEVGGPPFLFPLANKDKYYDLKDVARLVEVPDGLIIGAGLGPYRSVGTNCEMIPNLATGPAFNNKSWYAKVGENGSCVLDKLPENETSFGILLNFYACQGKQGNVLKIKAKKRKGEKDFVGCMRTALENEYGDRSVGMGGTFRIIEGTAKIHIMSDFLTTPLNTKEEENNWLKFYNMDAPMTFMSVLVSKDPGMDLRLEHSHGFGKDQGGHYHYDTTPDVVEYEGYFNIAEYVYRLDRPKKQ